MQKNILLAPLIFGWFQAKAQGKHLKTGDMIPLFSLRDQNDSLFNIADYTGKKILVFYFYPRDESSGCTKEACSLNFCG